MSWEEALDSAIYKISQLKDLESDYGKEQLGIILDQLKLDQLRTQSEIAEVGES